MKGHSFDVLTILDNIDAVDIIQTTFEPECLGAFFDDKVAKLYFDYGSKNKIEVQLNRLRQHRSINYLWDVLKSEDWHLAWKDNFQPIIIDNKLTIIPDWEDISTTEFSVKIKLNNIIDGVNFFHNNVLDWRELDYDFIIANINQQIIEDLIPKFKSTNANIILSGVLAENSMIIEKLLQSINFKINENIIKNEWLCINTIKS